MNNFSLLPKEKTVFLYLSEILTNNDCEDFAGFFLCLMPHNVIGNCLHFDNLLLDNKKYLNSLLKKSASITLTPKENFDRFCIVSCSYLYTIIYYFCYMLDTEITLIYKNLIKLATIAYINVVTFAIKQSICLTSHHFLAFFSKFKEFAALSNNCTQNIVEINRIFESDENYNVAKNYFYTYLKEKSTTIWETNHVISYNDFPYQFNICYERNLNEKEINIFLLPNKTILKNNINYFFSEEHAMNFLCCSRSYFKNLNQKYFEQNIQNTTKRQCITFICLLNTFFKLEKNIKAIGYHDNFILNKKSFVKSKLFVCSLQIIIEVELLFPPQLTSDLSWKRRFVFLTRIKVFNFFLHVNLPPVFFLSQTQVLEQKQLKRLMTQYCNYYLKEKTKINKELLKDKNFWSNFPDDYKKQVSLGYLVN